MVPCCFQLLIFKFTYEPNHTHTRITNVAFNTNMFEYLQRKIYIMRIMIMTRVEMKALVHFLQFVFCCCRGRLCRHTYITRYWVKVQEKTSVFVFHSHGQSAPRPVVPLRIAVLCTTFSSVAPLLFDFYLALVPRQQCLVPAKLSRCCHHALRS